MMLHGFQPIPKCDAEAGQPIASMMVSGILQTPDKIGQEFHGSQQAGSTVPF